MTPTEWEQLRAENPEEYVKLYGQFQADKRNINNCANCPNNRGIKGLDKKPCGQYRCWQAC